MKEIELRVVEGFGDEWSRFDQSELSDSELERMGAVAADGQNRSHHVSANST
jgi:hypothetical protein